MPSATIIISPIGTQTAGTPFKVSGTYALAQGTWTNALVYTTDGTHSTPLPAQVTTTGQSNWTMTHPAMAAGLHTISIKDPLSGALVTSNQFQVLGAKSITVAAIASIPQGQPVIVTGSLSGYQTAPTISYRLDGGALVTISVVTVPPGGTPPPNSGTVTTTTFSFSLGTPAAGSHTVVVTDGSISSTSTPFTVTAIVRSITVAAIPDTTIGNAFTLSGTLGNYTAAPSLTYKIDTGTAVAVTGVTPTSFSMSVVSPSPAGSHTITVSDGTVSTPRTFNSLAVPHTITVLDIGTVNAGQQFTFKGNLAGYTTSPSLTYAINAGAAVAITGVTTSGWTMSLTAPATAGTYSIAATDGTTTSAAVSFTVVVAVPASKRDWTVNPAEDGSFWVSPFDNNASFITTGPMVTLLRNGTSGSVPRGIINNGPNNWGVPFYVGGPSDPIVKVTDGTKTIFVRIPVGATWEQPGDFTMGGCDTTQPYLMWGGGVTSMTNAAGASISTVPAGTGTTINVVNMDVSDGSGKLFMDIVTGQNGSANAYGNLNEYDLLQGATNPNYVVQHMLACSLDFAMVNTTGPIWPLKVIDLSGGSTSTGLLSQGLTFGIPKGTPYPTAKIGNRAFKFLFDQAQQFGWFYYNVNGGGCAELCSYSLSSTTATFVTALQAEISAIMALMSILDYTPGNAGAQYSIDTQKGKLPGVAYSPAFSVPPPLDYTPTGGVPVLPSSFGAWYNSSYNVKSAPGGSKPPSGNATVGWSATDRSSFTTVSADGYTATATGNTTPYFQRQGVRSTGTIPVDTTRLIVWEITASALTQNYSTGVATSAFDYNNTQPGSDTKYAAYFPSTGSGSQPPQTFYFNNSQVTTGNNVASTAGDVTTFAMVGSKIWFSDAAMRSTSGVQWCGDTTSNPATGAGGVDLSAMTFPVIPAFVTAEAGGVAVINDGTKPFSSFLSGFISAHTTVTIKSLSGTISTGGNPGGGGGGTGKSIIPQTPSGVVAGQSFQFAGSLTGYTTNPTLLYSIDGAAFQPLSATITTTTTGGGTPLMYSDFSSLNITEQGGAPTGGSGGVTVVSAGSGQTFTTSEGTWSISSTNSVLLNNVAAGFTANVAKLAKDASNNVFHENTSNSWYQWAGLASNSWNPYGADPTAGGSAGSWMACYPFGGSEFVLAWNNEIAYNAFPPRTSYNPFTIVNGQLVITADNASNSGGNPLGLPYNTGVISSASRGNGIPLPGLFAGWGFYTEMRAKLPIGQGFWPSYWMVPLNSPWNGEIDIFEAYIHDGRSIEMTVHSASSGTMEALASNTVKHDDHQCIANIPNYDSNFHIYGFGWDDSFLTWYIDRVPVCRYPTVAPFDRASGPWYIIVAFSIGGNNSASGPPDSTTHFPAPNYIIDYIGAWSDFASAQNGVGTTTITGWTSTISIPTSGNHTITVSDGTNTGATASFAVTGTGTGGGTALTGLNLSNRTASHTAAVGTVVGSLTPQTNGVAATGASYSIASQTAPGGGTTASAILTLLNNTKGHGVLSGQFLSHTGNLGDMTAINNINAQTGQWLAMTGIDNWYPSASPSLRTNSGNAAAKTYWQQGGLIHLSQHYPNPQTGGDAFTGTSNGGPVIDMGALLTSGTSQNNTLNGMIDWTISSIQDLNSVGCVPMVRLYHESNGPWFWWGNGSIPNNTDYNNLFKYTVNRIRAAGVQWLIVWNLNGGFNSGNVTDRYPGSSFVDIVSWDFYDTGGNDSGDASALNGLGKPIFLAEFGPGLSPQDGWPETTLTTNLKNNMSNVVMWQQWWGGYSMDRTSNLSAALGDPWVINRGEFSLTATPTNALGISGSNLIINATGLTAGTYNVNVRVSATNVNNSPQTYPLTVTLT